MNLKERKVDLSLYKNKKRRSYQMEKIMYSKRSNQVECLGQELVGVILQTLLKLPVTNPPILEMTKLQISKLNIAF